jgi:hypothetical protein
MGRDRIQSKKTRKHTTVKDLAAARTPSHEAMKITGGFIDASMVYGSADFVVQPDVTSKVKRG